MTAVAEGPKREAEALLALHLALGGHDRLDGRRVRESEAFWRAIQR